MKVSRKLKVSLVILTALASSLVAVLIIAGLPNPVLALTGVPRAIEITLPKPASSVATNAINPTPPGETVKLIFIHQSTGARWLHRNFGRLGVALNDNNYYVSDAHRQTADDPYDIAVRTDIGDWYEWFAGPNSEEITGWLYNLDNTRYNSIPNPDEDRENEIIMFKSCFPNSNIWGDPDDPPNDDPDPPRGFAPDSPDHNVANVKRIYVDILEYFETRQDKLFILITAPPLLLDDTDEIRASNARAINNWLVHDWLADYSYHNVAVFDFYNVLTTNGGDADTNDYGSDMGNHHRLITTTTPIVTQHKTDGDDDVYPNVLEYPTENGTDNHPSIAGYEKATGEFVPLLNAYYNCWEHGDCWEDAPGWISVTAATDWASIYPGETATYTLSVTASAGSNARVTLTLQDAPSDASVSFYPNPVTPPDTSQLCVTPTVSIATGIYTMTVVGSSRVLTDAADLTLVVASVTPSFTLGISPTIRAAKPNQVVSYTVDVTGVTGFDQPVTLAAVGLPTDVGAVWSVNPVTPGHSSVLTLSIPSRPSFGHHLLRVVGIAGTQVVTEGIELIVDYPFKLYLPIILR